MDPEATIKHAYACYKVGDLLSARECINYFLKWRSNKGACRWEFTALADLLNQVLENEHEDLVGQSG